MFKLSRMADYGVVLLSTMARQQEARYSATELSVRTTLPAPTVSKILKLLSKADIVNSTRGAHGGYALSRPPVAITVAEIITAFDGPVALTACVGGSDDSCAVESLCPMAGGWNKINLAVKTALDSVTLADMLSDTSVNFLPVPGSEEKPAAIG